MGFIDWHGTKENRYDEVVDYAQMQIEEDEKERNLNAGRQFLTGFIGDERFTRIEVNDVIKFAIKEYRNLDSVYSKIVNEIADISFDKEQLWQDFIYYSLSQPLSYSNVDAIKKEKLIETLSKKAFPSMGKTSIEEFFKYKRDNKRYLLYLNNCFNNMHSEEIHFWKLVADNREASLEFADSLCKFQAFYWCYIFLMLNEGQEWIVEVERSNGRIGTIKDKIKKNLIGSVKEKRLINPIYGTISNDFYGVLRHCGVIIFNIKDKYREYDMGKIEEIYSWINENEDISREIDEILTEESIAQIKSGILPVFPNNEGGIRLLEEEKLHYINHGIIFSKQYGGDDGEYNSVGGTLYITNKRILFRGGSVVDIDVSDLERTVQYDAIPEILEFITSNESICIQTPNSALTYEVLKLIAKQMSNQGVEEKEIPLSYEELIEKAEIGAFVFAFKYYNAEEADEKLHTVTEECIKNLDYLKILLEKYPERKTEIQRFMSYYIPEAVKLINEYQQYKIAGIEDKTIKTIQEKIYTAVMTLNAAIEKKITDIYNIATMNTIADADTLKEVLRQDGYLQGDSVLKH